MIARGLGRSYGDAAQNAGGDVLSSGNLDGVLAIDVDKGTVTVESGVSLDTLLRVLLPLGWFPMVIPGTSYVTVGGAIASDIHGKFRHGSFADYVERMRVVTPDARCAGPRARRRRRTPFWATSGGMGLTGVITEATLKLQPVETSRIVCDTERTVDVDDCMARMLDGDHEYRYSVAWIDCLATGRRPRPGRADAAATTRRSTTCPRPTARPLASTRPARCSACRPSLPNGLINPLSAAAPSTRCGSARRRARCTGGSRASSPSSSRSTASATGTASTARAASCSTSSSCRSERSTSCAPRSSASARPGSRCSSRCSSDSSTTAGR